MTLLHKSRVHEARTSVLDGDGPLATDCKIVWSLQAAITELHASTTVSVIETRLNT